LVTSAEENRSEFLLLQVHVIPTISEKPIAFVELKSAAMSKKRPCFWRHAHKLAKIIANNAPIQPQMWQARAHRAGFRIVRKLTPKKSATSRVVSLCGKGCAACFVSSRPKTTSTPWSQKESDHETSSFVCCNSHFCSSCHA
jgi:hypothetical protein